MNSSVFEILKRFIYASFYNINRWSHEYLLLNTQFLIIIRAYVTHHFTMPIFHRDIYTLLWQEKIAFCSRTLFLAPAMALLSVIMTGRPKNRKQKVTLSSITKNTLPRVINWLWWAIHSDRFSVNKGIKIKTYQQPWHLLLVRNNLLHFVKWSE